MPTLTPYTETVYLYQGDDLKRINELAEAVSSAISTRGPRKAGAKDPMLAAARAHDEFVTEAKERAVQIEVGHVRRSEWRQMRADHPIRMETVKEKDAEGNEVEVERPNAVDESWGFNAESIADDLVPAAIVPGQFKSAKDRDDFLDDLSDADFTTIYFAARRLNTQPTAASSPKANLSSRIDQIIDATSTSRGLSD